MRQPVAVGVIATNFGIVKVKKSTADWIEAPAKKKDRLSRLDRVERAASLLSELKWELGGWQKEI